MAKVQVNPEITDAEAEAEIEKLTYDAQPMLVGVRGKIHKEVYRDVSAAVTRSGQDQGLFIEAGLRLFMNLSKEDKVKLLAEIGANRMADSF